MKFTTAEIITAGTGKLCCQMEGVYKILNFLTGDNLYTHQLPRAFRACEAWVIEQHPWLKELDESKCNPETVWEWLADAEARFGKMHELQPLPQDRWLSKGPVAELLEMEVPRDRIITVEAQ